MTSSVVDVFIDCCTAIRKGTLITRSSRQDKEFSFQNWFEDRLSSLKLNYDPPARNSYPDFRLVKIPEGYEVKGLAYPGRETNYDANSQMPTGFHLLGLGAAFDSRSQPVLSLLSCVRVHVWIERYVIEMLDIFKRIEGQF